MLTHGLQGLHKTAIILPRQPKFHPSPERLESDTAGSGWQQEVNEMTTPVQQVAQADSAECHAACGEDGQASCHPAATPLSHTVGCQVTGRLGEHEVCLEVWQVI